MSNLRKIIENLEITQTRLISALPTQIRPFSEKLFPTEKRGALIVGPRGTGKTTLLLEASKNANMIYLSADNPALAPHSLTDLAEAAFAEGYEGIIVDEVHHAKSWSTHLKSIYDSHPKKKIWISDSNSLILRLTSADLTRRFPKFYLPFTSFREYLALKKDIVLDPFNPFNSKVDAFELVTKKVNVMGLFKSYLSEGFRPIFMEGDYTEKILSIIEKSVFFDVPFFVPSIVDNHLRLMNAIIGYLSASPIPTVNADSLASEWSVGKTKLYELLNVMEQIGLINIIRFKSDKSKLGKGAKLLFADPALYQALGGLKGNTREAFVAMILTQAGGKLFACKDERSGDFIWGDYTLEIGGRNKSRKKSDFVIRDDIELPSRSSIPMWSLGFMY